jgi:hypothetical protein
LAVLAAPPKINLAKEDSPQWLSYKIADQSSPMLETNATCYQIPERIDAI